jgi:hypothetical protein
MLQPRSVSWPGPCAATTRSGSPLVTAPRRRSRLAVGGCRSAVRGVARLGDEPAEATLGSYVTFADTDLLTELVTERMLADISPAVYLSGRTRTRR